MRFKIEKSASIHLGCHFNSTSFFCLGKNSTINQFCHLDNRGGIYIGSNVSISPQTSIVTSDHDVSDPSCPGRSMPITIEDYVFIGFRAVILPNCTIKMGSVIGAMSLVTKSTEPLGIYMGVPAKLVKQRHKDLNYTAEYRRMFH